MSAEWNGDAAGAGADGFEHPHVAIAIPIATAGITPVRRPGSMFDVTRVLLSHSDPGNPETNQ